MIRILLVTLFVLTGTKSLAAPCEIDGKLPYEQKQVKDSTLFFDKAKTISFALECEKNVTMAQQQEMLSYFPKTSPAADDIVYVDLGSSENVTSRLYFDMTRGYLVKMAMIGKGDVNKVHAAAMDALGKIRR